jgi:hypothetical protein
MCGKNKEKILSTLTQLILCNLSFNCDSINDESNQTKKQYNNFFKKYLIKLICCFVPLKKWRRKIRGKNIK